MISKTFLEVNMFVLDRDKEVAASDGKAYAKGRFDHMFMPEFDVVEYCKNTREGNRTIEWVAREILKVALVSGCELRKSEEPDA